jgi:flavin reductase (DIM6/NTAB) family NADH-FMN oxidoreductase RutF
MNDHRALRDAFGCFATGVTVVTSLAEGRPVGLTANSFASVSLDPPLLLVCLANGASSLPAIRAHGRFGVSVLSASQGAVAERFARRGGNRFELGDWVEAESGVPLLEGACANFACSVHQDIASGDHILLVGRIDSFRAAPDRAPLLYVRGRYA